VEMTNEGIEDVRKGTSTIRRMGREGKLYGLQAVKRRNVGGKQ
jgi:hypothetical protein